MKRTFDFLASDEKQKIVNLDFVSSIIVEENIEEDIPLAHRQDVLNFTEYSFEKNILGQNLISLLEFTFKGYIQESNLKTSDFGFEKIMDDPLIGVRDLYVIRIHFIDVKLSLGKYDVDLSIFIQSYKILVKIETYIYNVNDFPTRRRELYTDPKVNQILTDIESIIKKFLNNLIQFHALLPKKIMRNHTGKYLYEAEDKISDFLGLPRMKGGKSHKSRKSIKRKSRKSIKRKSRKFIKRKSCK